MNSSHSASESSLIRVEVADSDELFNYVFFIRTQVFVEETSVDQEDEYDGFDHLSTHFLAWYGNNPAGAARRRRLMSGAIKLERFAVLKEFRSKGIGAALVHAGLEGLPPGTKVLIHSLSSKVTYYQRFGFEPVGEEFEEAGMMHQEMVLTTPIEP
ncbi:MAG: GNAT family N-acetyltransferase [Bacteroidia bacterium]|nr:GNAT family N-acetyltransferase [Bacteroidia bacterium]